MYSLNNCSTQYYSYFQTNKLLLEGSTGEDRLVGAILAVDASVAKLGLTDTLAIVAPELGTPAAYFGRRVLGSCAWSLIIIIIATGTGRPAPLGRLVAVVGAVLDAVAKGVAVDTGAVVAAEGPRIAG